MIISASALASDREHHDRREHGRPAGPSIASPASRANSAALVDLLDRHEIHERRRGGHVDDGDARRRRRPAPAAACGAASRTSSGDPARLPEPAEREEHADERRAPSPRRAARSPTAARRTASKCDQLPLTPRTPQRPRPRTPGSLSAGHHRRARARSASARSCSGAPASR